MANIETFEKHAEQDEACFERTRFAYESKLRVVKMLMMESSNGIEIGVGNGRFAGPLGIKIGVEPSAAMRATAYDLPVITITDLSPYYEEFR